MNSEVFGLRILARPAFQRAALLVIAAILVVFRGWQFIGLASDPFGPNDFASYWTAGRNLLAGESIYTAAQLGGTYVPEGGLLYLYPPPFAVLVAPLAALIPTDYRLAGAIWAAIGSLILVVSVVAITRAEGLDRRIPNLPGPGVAYFVVAAFVMTPVIAELAVGNVHLEILGLLSLAWLGIRRSDRTGDSVAGLAIAAATLVKLFPGLLILWLLLTGRRHAAAWAIAGIALLAVASLPFTGLQAWLDYPRVLLNMGPIVDVYDSVSAAVWLAPLFGYDVARWFVIAAGVALAAWTAKSRPTTVSYAIAVATSVLVAPSVFHHYLAVLVLPLLLALAAGVRPAVVVAAYLLLWGGQQSSLGEWAWVLSRVPQTLGWMLLLAALVTLSRPGSSSRTSMTLAPAA